jgi:hypothetical protein
VPIGGRPGAALIVPGLPVPNGVAPRLVAAVFSGAPALHLGKPWAALLVGMSVYWSLSAPGV